MQTTDFDSLFSTLNEAVAILSRHRSSDPEFVLALDTLKQARARIARLTEPADVASTPASGELVAA